MKKLLLKLDKNYYRPTEVKYVAREILVRQKKTIELEPKTNLEHLVKLWLNADMEKIKKRRY